MATNGHIKAGNWEFEELQEELQAYVKRIPCYLAVVRHAVSVMGKCISATQAGPLKGD